MRRSKIRSKSGPKTKWRPTFKAIKFEMPPERARLVSYDFLRKDGIVTPTYSDASMTRWIYKKGNKFYTIIVDGVIIGSYTASDWREGRAIRLK